jgi:HAD superfamily hydrolase (TIGR01509 family)
MIEAIIFDLGGVIIGNSNAFRLKLGRILNREILPGTWKGPPFKALLEGKITEDDYWDLVKKENGWDIGSEKLKSAFREHITLNESTIKIVEKLRKNGIRLGLLSAHAREWIAYFNGKYDFERYFDVVIYSFQKGYTKPDRRLYVDMQREIRIPAGSCLYTDDKEQFLAPAQELGMQTVLFTSAGSFSRHLALAGVTL